MIRNFFKITVRNLWRNKAFSAINISGLAIGMAAAMLILLWVDNEISVDRFHEKLDRIYVMFNRDRISGELSAWNNNPKPMGPALKAEYPEVEDAVRFNNITFLLTAGEKKFNNRGAFVDDGFLSLFSYPLLKGSRTDALKRNYSIVLTEQMAISLFGKEDPIGKTVRIDSTDNFTVTAVLKDRILRCSFAR